MKKIISIIFISVLFSTCKKRDTPPPCQDDLNLTADDLSWNPYTNGEIIVFKSNTGLYDTGKIRSWVGFSDGGKDANGCEHLTQILNVDIDSFQINTGKIFELFVGHYNKWMNGPFPNDAEYYGFYSGGYGGSGATLSNLTPQNNIIINSITYNNVYIISKDTTQNTNPQDIWRMYYTKQQGLLEFDCWHGLSWFKI